MPFLNSREILNRFTLERLKDDVDIENRQMLYTMNTSKNRSYFMKIKIIKYHIRGPGKVEMKRVLKTEVTKK